MTDPRDPAIIWSDLDAALDDAVEQQAALDVTMTKVAGLQAEMNDAAPPEPVDPEPPIDPEPPEPVDPPDPDPGKWLCSAPHMGPIRRTKGKVLLCNNVGDPSVAPFRDRIPKLFNGSVYMVGAHMGAKAGTNEVPFDHSNAGIAKHSKAAWSSFKSRRPQQNNAKSAWFDVEADIASMNVPSSVGYSRNESVSKYKRPGYANTYDIDIEKAWRDEAVRFFGLLCKGILACAKEDGFDDFELGSYNHPNETSLSNVDNNSRYATQAAELNKQLLCPYMAFGGANCYPTAGTTASQKGLTQAQVVKRAIDKARTQTEKFRAVIPKPQKLIPAIFNCWVATPMADGDPIPPAGMLGDMTKAILDAGADGIYIYENSDPNNRQARAVARYNEVIDVIIKRGDFVTV